MIYPADTLQTKHWLIPITARAPIIFIHFFMTFLFYLSRDPFTLAPCYELQSINIKSIIQGTLVNPCLDLGDCTIGQLIAVFGHGRIP